MIRRIVVLLALFAAAVTACAPPPVSTPTAIASLGLVGLPADRASSVQLSVSTTNFQTGSTAPSLSVAYRIIDDTTHAVVEQRTVDISGAQGIVATVPISGFAPDTSTLDGRIHARAEITVSQAATSGPLSAVGSVDEVLTWTMPTSPYVGALVPHDPPNYQLTDVLGAFCGPLGRTIHVTSPDTPDPMTITQAIPGNPFSNPVTIPTGGGEATFSTVTECVVLLVTRASFTGSLAGEAHFTVEF